MTGVKIKKGAVTASKINTKGLTVPNANHATSADSATNATNLGGVAASHYVSKSGVLTIPGSAFHSRGTRQNSGCIPDTTTGNTSPTNLYAPVNLPDGVTITKVTYYWWDNDGAANTTALPLVIPVPAASGPFTMATAVSTRSAGVHTSSSTTSVSNPVINNTSNMYYVKTTIPNAGLTRTDAVQITYSG